jgi:twinkle protein
VKIKQYLTDKGFEFKEVNRPSGVNAIMVCPFCHGGDKSEKTFAINLETGAWNCMRLNNCGLTGSFYNLQRKLGDQPVFLKNNVSNRAKVYSRPKLKAFPTINQPAMQYLQSRGFTEETLSKFKVFLSKNEEIGLPYYKGKSLVNVKYRTLDKKFRQEKNAEPCLFNRDSITGETLIITEGEFDCMALDQYGFSNITSLPSGVNDHRWIENEWDFLEQFEDIYLCLDDDDAGHSAITVLVSRLGSWRCKSVIFPHKDALDCLKHKISKKDMEDCFFNAIEYPPNTIVAASDYVDEVVDLFIKPDALNGVSTGFPGLNYFLKGWRPGELTVWSGQSGSGKTTIINQVFLTLTSLNIKTCIASLELRPARYLRWAVCQALGKVNPTVNEVNSVFEWFYEKVYILNVSEEIEPDHIFNVFEYAARRYGVKHFVVDSLMRIKLSQQDVYAAQKEFVSRLLTFTRKYKAHCHLVAHPRKTTSDRDKPDKVDIKGSSDITNLADNVLVLWRPPDEQKAKNDPDAILLIKKNREFGELGGVKLFFDKSTKRLSCENQEINFYF